MLVLVTARLDVRGEILHGEQLLSRCKDVLRQTLNVKPKITPVALVLEPEVEIKSIDVSITRMGFTAIPCALSPSMASSPRQIFDA
jgi:hypothetical protein